MTYAVRKLVVVGALAAWAGITAAEPQPIEHFARMPQIRDVTISPDGRYVAFISAADDASVIMAFDRQSNGEFQRLTASEPDKFDVTRCEWANNSRLLCTVSGNIRGKRYAETPFVRLIAVDADGSNLKVLEVSGEKGNLLAAKTTPQNLHLNVNMRANMAPGDNTGGRADYTQKNVGNWGRSWSGANSQRQDLVLDTTPDEDATVLIQVDHDGNGYPSVFGLNIYNGLREFRLRERVPIRQFMTDAKGEVRLAWGSTDGLSKLFFTRVEGENEWRPLAKIPAFSDERQLEPIGVAHRKDTAYAVGQYEDRQALWALDLTDQRAPEVLFSHPLVDVGEPLLTPDRRLLGVRYDLDRPFVYYSDESVRGVMDQINSKLSPHFSLIVDMTRDEKTFVIRSYSDVDDGTYYLFNRDEKKLLRLGVAYPELKTDGLGTMRSITYKASDGTEIPGYLTVPSGVRAENLPLVVMPHDGPNARDTWSFSFLRTFLANRGYAVLQMNFRGSIGYGHKWQLAAHQDWGGLPYSDIVDATRWAIAEGIADPKRVCIVGWGFGGYAALLGAARNGDLYRCSISIAGFSDLEMLSDHAVIFGRAEAAYRREQIGSDSAKLSRNSPLQHVANINTPVLLVHGEKDWNVQVDHSKKMESALKKQKKEHKAVYIKGANHELARKSDRVTLLREVEAFLAKHLG